jgi:hypothetical protein
MAEGRVSGITGPLMNNRPLKEDSHLHTRCRENLKSEQTTLFSPQTIVCDRFLQILKYLHFADSENQPKLWQILEA